MHFLIVADSFFPSKNSTAVQITHLAKELFNQGHEVTLFIPTSDINSSYSIEEFDYAKIIFIKIPFLKSSKNIIRALAELLMPFLMIKLIKKNDLFNFKIDGLIWYSPSIFHGHLIRYIKKISNAKAYLIIRDIFPEWAVDLKLMNKGLIYYFFKLVEKYQYKQADIIGVQSPGNLKYFISSANKQNFSLEVLNNWLLKDLKKRECSISLNKSKLKGRKIFIYAGNMGVAQGMNILIDLANSFSSNHDIGFVFVGRGASMKALQDKADKLKLENTLFFDEIHPDEIPSLYDQCSVGLISLDLRHKSHNIPGKFLTYMQSALPVLASVNPENDLIDIIKFSKVGSVSSNGVLANLRNNADKILYELESTNNYETNCTKLFNERYSAEKIVNQIINNFKK
tara:strand:- start:1080 stop:2273 length:1194 start_codon:yes stop_codon:yes gene_type:complete